MNKIFSKKIFIKENIPTADFRVYEKGEEIPKNIKYPAVVKPYFAGSSLGVSIVSGPKDLPQALKVAISLQDKAIIEDYIDGKELTVGILGSIPLGVVEIIPKKGYYDFSAKYSDAQTQFIAPARLEKNIYERVQDVALGAHLALGCRGFSRVDMRLNSRNEISVLEVNSIPGLTSHSLLPISASVCGISFDELILTMVKLSLNERTIVEEARKK
jgi:D-alanine-D-alanine ligase